ncbi:MAG: hypothetical protein MJ182_08045, partial [Treponema sp.]|nr:hypothetical protein [Treponema sp.]
LHTFFVKHKREIDIPSDGYAVKMLEEHFERGKRGAPATSCRLGGDPPFLFLFNCDKLWRR